MKQREAGCPSSKFIVTQLPHSSCRWWKKKKDGVEKENKNDETKLSFCVYVCVRA